MLQGGLLKDVEQPVTNYPSESCGMAKHLLLLVKVIPRLFI